MPRDHGSGLDTPIRESIFAHFSHKKGKNGSFFGKIGVFTYLMGIIK